MIGDAVVDIEAAKSAQLASVIAITHGFGTRAELEAAEADHIIDSLLELPNLIDRIEQHESR
jgi:phosphoglycolate phosphatase-like HAD superfamily hydrolase